MSPSSSHPSSGHASSGQASSGQASSWQASSGQASSWQASSWQASSRHASFGHRLLPFLAPAIVASLAMGACGDEGPSPGEPSDAVELDSTDAGVDAPDSGADVDGSGDGAPFEWPERIDVLVTLDGTPSPDTLVMQGGAATHVRTGADGRATLLVDEGVIGDLSVIASHPDARILAVTLDAGTPTPVLVALQRFDRDDNGEYAFQDPGEPRNSPNTDQCGHCHQNIDRAWFDSPHSTAARNWTVHDLYRGTAFRLRDREACEAGGGAWSPTPALGDPARTEQRCFVGQGVVPTLNPGCDGPACEVEQRAMCADCHAPATTGPGGELGGQDLRAATGNAFRYGVFCDVCHKVEAVYPDAPAPGVAGRLRILRPSEPREGPLGPWSPLTFGPSHDSPNPRMGSVQRAHFRDGTLCSGCHQLDQPVLVPGAAIDLGRWPDGTLPIHSTWREWAEGPLAEAVPCNECHMPPDPLVYNGGDLQLFPLSEIGVQGGWYRPPGAVRRHSWLGPRTPGSRMLQLAAALFVDTTRAGDRLEVRVTTRNVGPAHAIPTGEPMRSLLLTVDVLCGETPQRAVGGHVVPDFGGALAARSSDGDWSRWPDARPGDGVRVVRRTGAWHDYDGFGPFGDGRFDAEDKGMPVEEFVGERGVIEVGEDGLVAFDAALPAGDFAYLVRGEQALAGRPGFGFARVLVGADGARMVPHFAAVDVASDNRLLPQDEWRSEHAFEVACDEPVVVARLIHRPYPLELALERNWLLDDQIMAEVRR